MRPLHLNEYSIFGLKVTVQSPDQRIRDHIGAFLDRCQNGEEKPLLEVQIDFVLHSAEYFSKKLTIPKSAALISSPELPVKVYKTDGEFYLVFKGSWLHLSLEKFHGAGVFDGKIWDCPGAAENFFFSGLCVLLHDSGLYRLHAAGLNFREKGCLIIGKSGAGKSTLALTLIKQGWKYLNDDVLFLRLQNSRIEALAIPIEFKTDDRTFHRFFTEPEHDLAFKLPQREGFPHYDKYYVHVERLFPKKFDSHCLPKFLLFTEVASEAASKLEILDRHETLKRLIESSLLFMFDAESAHQHLTALNALVQQTTAYRLCAGRDVLDKPEAFEKFLLDNTYRMEK